jgi:23S rRNA pseudouridine2605 synthase
MTAPSAPSGEGERLQKVLARAGLGSRRACEQLIAQGRVEVDGRIVREQGVRVDPATAVIRVDGDRLSTAPDRVYLAFNKPAGMVSTMSDPEGRPSVGDVVARLQERVFHVGRLDTDSEGLLILTNDGTLAHRLSHPSFEVPKTYLVEIQGPVPRSLGRTLRGGVDLDDGTASVDSFRVVTSGAGTALVEVVLHDGRNRIVRRMFAAVDRPVLRLVRTHVGPIPLGELRPGRYRALSRQELASLYAAVEL